MTWKMINLRCPRIDLDELGPIRDMVYDEVKTNEAGELKVPRNRASRSEHRLSRDPTDDSSQSKSAPTLNDLYCNTGQHIAPPTGDRAIGDLPVNV